MGRNPICDYGGSFRLLILKLFVGGCFLLGPLEGLKFFAAEFFEVWFSSAGAIISADVEPNVLTKDLAAKCSHSWVVFDHFLASVDVTRRLLLKQFR